MVGIGIGVGQIVSDEGKGAVLACSLMPETSGEANSDKGPVNVYHCAVPSDANRGVFDRIAKDGSEGLCVCGGSALVKGFIAQGNDFFWCLSVNTCHP